MMPDDMPSDKPRATINIGPWELEIYDGAPPAPPAALEDRFEGDHKPMQVRAVHPTRGLVLAATLPATLSSEYIEPRLHLLFVPETETLFIAGGETALAYQLNPPRQVMYTDAEHGFWTWHRAGDVIVMEVELSLVAFDTRGTTLWSAYFEPPHSVWVEGDNLRLQADQCNHIKDFKGVINARKGPPTEPQP